MPGLKPRVGYTELQQFPEDGRRYELYDGEVVVVPSPLPIHQIIADRLTELLLRYASTTGGLAISAPLDIVFSEHDVLQPDVVFFTAARRHFIDLRAPIRHPPDLVVEVLSPSTESRDRGRKLQMFARFGVTEYWIVDSGTGGGDEPQGRIEILSLADPGGDQPGYALVQVAAAANRCRSPLLSGLEFSAGTILEV